MQYIRPNLIATVTKELLCTYRNPMDVACALNKENQKSPIGYLMFWLVVTGKPDHSTPSNMVELGDGHLNVNL
ncbi:hypothetical protein EVAR_35790_1 [Eumeta japonica]|uniref:Uncharacterized protein n=1 Tax=Eumeta variegata TaxID=151549 RepID=A0A4C1WP17_EUMVA|nr:hypothetical protein EVAR_35790_1 [Eumeta japonica]